MKTIAPYMERRHLEEHMEFITDMVMTAWDECRFVDASVVRQEIQVPHTVLEDGSMLEHFVLGETTITIKLAATEDIGGHARALAGSLCLGCGHRFVGSAGCPRCGSAHEIKPLVRAGEEGAE